MKNVKPRRVFNNYQRLLNPLFKAYAIFVGSAGEIVEFTGNSPLKRPVTPEVTFTPSSEANGWKFSMNLTYDFSNNPNKEEVSKLMNGLISTISNPIPKK